MTESGTTLLRTVDLVRTFQAGGETVRALDGVSLSVRPGEFVSVMGRSGSGKSTLLNLIGCLDRPTSGSIWIEGEEVTRAPKRALPRVRSRKIGFVFQQYNLIPSLTALENVMLPLKYGGVSMRERHARAAEALALVGLAPRAGSMPSQLSGGQQQRVAIARALVVRPALLLGDELTGALDSQTATEVVELLRRLNHSQGQTCILVTHDPLVASRTNRLIRLRDGRIESDTPVAAHDEWAVLPAPPAGAVARAAIAADQVAARP